MAIRKEKIKVFEMTCTSCENSVERAVRKLEGVENVKASFSGQYAEVEYDDMYCNQNKIKAAVKSAGYSTEGSKDYKIIGILIVVAAIVLLGINTSGFDMEAKLANASYGVLFFVGILTSIHCVGMCGGIMLSQSLSKESSSRFEAVKPALLYNLGRVISYTILGGIIGALGSVFSLSLGAKAGLQIFAGVFMIMMGFNMAGFSAFRKFQIRLPHAVCKIKNTSGSPLVVGLLNGLMPCGPLQTMQLFALGTGSAVSGALSMFMFSIGTVPLMLTFGAVSGLLSKGYTKKILKFSGVLIIVLGLIMENRGFALMGINISPMAILSNFAAASPSSTSSGSSGGSSAPANGTKAVIKDGVQTLNMTADSRGYVPNVLYVQKGIPVKWVVNATQLTSCNNAIVVPSINKQQKLKSGENIIEFTPGDKDLKFSCWMGMIRGTIKVVDDLNAVNASSSSASNSSENSAAGVPTENLIKKAEVSTTSQQMGIKVTGYEIDPLISVAKRGVKMEMSFDVSASDYPEGNYFIEDGTTGKVIKAFKGNKGTVQIEFTLDKTGPYAITIDGGLIGIIEAVDDVEAANLDQIRSKYIK